MDLKFNFITADGGFDFSVDFNNQEQRDENEEINGIFAIFDKRSFVNAVPHPNLKPLIEKMVKTQMFSKMIQERSERGHGIDKLVFFEEIYTVIRS